MALFVNQNDAVVTGNRGTGRVLFWYNGTNNVTTIIQVNSSIVDSVFVTSDDQIFVHNSQSGNRIDQLSMKNQTLIVSIPTDSACYGLFIDVDHNLYCSQTNSHQIVTYLLTDPSYPSTLVAGTGCAGSTSWMINWPHGIFVTIDKYLYVADCLNHRIQRFQYGQRNGTTVIGNGPNSTIIFNCPAGVTLDGDGYLFIVDGANHRIIGSGPYGYRCVAGCSGLSGSASDRLSLPRTVYFDSNANLYVLDSANSRIQKFELIFNQSSKL